MRIYIATAYPKAAELAIPYVKRLETVGIGITCKWWEVAAKTCYPPLPRVPETELPLDEQKRIALNDLQGVRDADIVWLMSPGSAGPREGEYMYAGFAPAYSGGTGCWFEMGYAFALGKTVVYSGHPRTIFSSLVAKQFAEHEGAFEYIVGESGRRIFSEKLPR